MNYLSNHIISYFYFFIYFFLFCNVATSHGRSLMYLAFLLLYRHVILEVVLLLYYSLYSIFLYFWCSEVGMAANIISFSSTFFITVDGVDILIRYRNRLPSSSSPFLICLPVFPPHCRSRVRASLRCKNASSPGWVRKKRKDWDANRPPLALLRCSSALVHYSTMPRHIISYCQ